MCVQNIEKGKDTVTGHHSHLKRKDHQDHIQIDQDPPASEGIPAQGPGCGDSEKKLSEKDGKYLSYGIPEHNEKVRTIQQKLNISSQCGIQRKQLPFQISLIPIKDTSITGGQLFLAHKRIYPQEYHRKQKHKNRCCEKDPDQYSLFRISLFPPLFCFLAENQKDSQHSRQHHRSCGHLLHV